MDLSNIFTLCGLFTFFVFSLLLFANYLVYFSVDFSFLLKYNGGEAPTGRLGMCLSGEENMSHDGCVCPAIRDIAGKPPPAGSACVYPERKVSQGNMVESPISIKTYYIIDERRWRQLKERGLTGVDLK